MSQSNEENIARDRARVAVTVQIVKLGRSAMLAGFHALVSGLGALLVVLVVNPRTNPPLLLLTAAMLAFWLVYTVASAKTRRVRLGYWLAYQQWKRRAP